MTTRAYTTFVIKAIDEVKRTFTGVATTISTDRMGDIVDPKGAQFKLPIPLLWQHEHDSPVGSVTAARVSAKQIEIDGEFAQVEEEGDLKDFLDYAWQSIKAKLVRGLSIGFIPIDAEPIEGAWGIKFKLWEWLELSCVTIPANSEGSIQVVRSLDHDSMKKAGISYKKLMSPELKAALGLNKSKTPGATGKNNSVKLKPVEGHEMKTIAEQIAAFEAQRKKNLERMNAVMEKSAEDGSTLDDAQTEEFETLEAENASIDKHLPRLKSLDLANKATAAPVDGSSSSKGSDSRQPVTIRNTQKLDKGIEFARYVMCLGTAKGDLATASAIAQKRFPEMDRINNVLKAAVEAGTTTDATWAAPLVEYNDFAGDFVEFLRPQTILGKFGVGNVPALRRVPFNIHIKGQVSGGSGYWVGEGAPKPLTKFDFSDVYLPWAKVANIAVLTQELMRFSNPAAEGLVRDALASALVERLDADFVDPAKGLVTGVSPASITNGVVAHHSSGSTATAIRADIATLWGDFIAAKISPLTAVYLMSPATALSLSLMRTDLSTKEFEGITMNGGTLEGVPVIVSDYIPTLTAGSLVILVSASDIWLADDGQVVIDASREASLQMMDNPTNNSGDGTATTMVSMFQTDSVALRAERFINWKKRRASAVSVLDQVSW